MRHGVSVRRLGTVIIFNKPFSTVVGVLSEYGKKGITKRPVKMLAVQKVQDKRRFRWASQRPMQETQKPASPWPPSHASLDASFPPLLYGSGVDKNHRRGVFCGATSLPSCWWFCLPRTEHSKRPLTGMAVLFHCFCCSQRV